VIAGVLAILLAQASPSPSPSPSAPVPTTQPSVAPTVTPSPTPVPKPLFVAPKGWSKLGEEKSKDVWHVIGRWVHYTPNAYHSFNVVEGPNVGLNASDVAALNVQTLKRDRPKTHFTTNRAQALCDNAAGWVISYPASDMQYTQVIGVSSAHTYIATYAHSRNVSSDASGIAAAQSLCPPADVATRDLGPAPITAPAGWKQSNLAGLLENRPDLPAMWAWFSPPKDGQTEALIVMSIPSPSTAAPSNEALLQQVEIGMSKWASNIQVIETHPVALCRADGTSAKLYALVKGKPVEINVVASAGAPTTYAALYMRQLAAPALPEAQKALLSLCPADRQSPG
jgi:hypothetical protein